VAGDIDWAGLFRSILAEPAPAEYQHAGQVVSQAELLARMIVSKGVCGSLPAAEMIMDRLLGKPGRAERMTAEDMTVEDLIDEAGKNLLDSIAIPEEHRNE
jgi:hypothetical protein